MSSIVPNFEYLPALLLRQTGDNFISYRHPPTLIYQEEHLQRWRLRQTSNNSVN